MSQSSSTEAAGKPFDSKLPTGRERFLAQVVVHALKDKWRSAEDFVRHFSPSDLVESLTDDDDLRAELLVRGAGVHERLAKKKSVASGSEDLSIALSEGVCSPADLLDIYKPDDRVRYLDHAKLWAFVTEEKFWKAAADAPGKASSVKRTTFLIERALEQKLITLKGVVDALSIDAIANRVPENVLRKIVASALRLADKGSPLDAPALFNVTPLADLVSYLPQEEVWQNLVAPKLAEPNGLLTPGGEPAARPAQKSSSEGKVAAKDKEKAKDKTEPSKPKASGAPSKGRGKTPTAPAAAALKPEPDDNDEDFESVDDVTFDAPDSEPKGFASSAPPALSPAEMEALNEAADALRDIGRLPPSYESLSIPLLRSIESMYADLEGIGDDDDRESIIRDSFPNESLLRKAMLALIELLDPSIDTHEPLIRDADVDALIKIVLFEERRREEQRGDGSSPRRSAPPPARR